MDQHADRERWERIASIFTDAVERAAAGRSAFLDRACGADQGLRAELEAMLRAHESESGLLLEGWVEALQAGIDAAPGDLASGTRVGPYQIEALVGQGGMGEVYRAERVEGAYLQTVAIKVLRPGYRTAETVRRFGVERQALARLAHPNIAPILDAGALDDGRPYLVLQFVEGVPITEYCARHRLTVEARLLLFLAVAHAVQFAHSQLVIHRDIKPSNILVQSDGLPWLLDFGIAKLLDPSLAESLAVETRPEVRLLTPEHAAPEQLRGETPGTATDVYGLGALLFQLLTGRTPFSRWTGIPGELERAILELPAPAPSSLATADRRKLRGDLDRIVLMALRKEPDRRYASAGQFAEDVERFLAGLPVRAQPDTLRYRARKFVARNRGIVMAGLLVLMALIGFGTMMGLQARRIARERDRAERERVAATDVLRILTGLFEKANPRRVPGGDTVRVATLLEEAEQQIELLEDEPARQAALLRAVGRMHWARGRYDRAEALLRRSWEQQEATAGADDLEAARTYHELAQAVSAHRGSDAARGLFDSSAVRLRRLLGAEHAEVRAALQELALAAPDGATTRALLAQVVELERRSPGGDSIAIAARLTAEGSERWNRGRTAEAAALFEASLAILRVRRGPDDPDRLTVTHNLAAALGGRGEFTRAESLQRLVLETAERIRAPLSSLGGYQELLALSLANQGRLAEAETLEREALAKLGAGLAPEHPLIANALRNLAIVVAARGRVQEGLTLLDSAITRARTRGADGVRSWGYMVGQRVPLLLQLGRVEDAARAAAVADSLVRATSAEGEGRLAEADRWVGMVAFVRGRYGLAAERFARASELYRELLPARHPQAARASCLLGSALAAQGRRDAALPLLRNGCPVHDAWGLAEPLVGEWGRAALR